MGASGRRLRSQTLERCRDQDLPAQAWTRPGRIAICQPRRAEPCGQRRFAAAGRRRCADAAAAAIGRPPLPRWNRHACRASSSARQRAQESHPLRRPQAAVLPARGGAGAARAPAARPRAAEEAQARRLRRRLVRQERPHLAARHAVALLPGAPRPVRAPPDRLRQPASAQPRDPEDLLHPRQLYLKDYSPHLRQQGRLRRQEGRAAGAPSGRRRGLAIPPVALPHAAEQEGAQRLSRRMARRSGSSSSSPSARQASPR